MWKLSNFTDLFLFYVKSILADCITSKISHLKMSKVCKNSIFRAAQMVKMAVLGA